MVCDVLVEAVVHQSIGDINVLREQLVKATSMCVGDGIVVKCNFEATFVKLECDMCHVVVKVTLYDHCCLCVLAEDISHDICHSLCSLLQVHLFARLEIAVEYLHLLAACCQSRPKEVVAKCLDKCEASLSCSSCPTPTIPSMHRLV